MRNAFVTWAAITVVIAGLLGWWLLRPSRERPVVIGVLLYMDSNTPTYQGFKQGLEELGLREGVNVRYIAPAPARTMEDIQKQAHDLVEMKPDLIFAAPTPAALAAKKATAELAPDLPVVFAPVNDPVASGVVRNLLRPEANLTGVRLAKSDDKRLEALLDVAPGIRTILVPYNPEDPSAAATLAALQGVDAELGVTLTPQPFPPGSRPDSPGFLPPGTQAIFLPRDGTVLSRVDEFVALCKAKRLPLSTPRLDQVPRGVLVGYGFKSEDVGRQAAHMAQDILAGESISAKPVETARDHLSLNLEAAREIGLVVPTAVIRRAQYVLRAEQ